jgi:hypothetical protein
MEAKLLRSTVCSRRVPQARAYALSGATLASAALVAAGTAVLAFVGTDDHGG